MNKLKLILTATETARSSASVTVPASVTAAEEDNHTVAKEMKQQSELMNGVIESLRQVAEGINVSHEQQTKVSLFFGLGGCLVGFSASLFMFLLNAD